MTASMIKLRSLPPCVLAAVFAFSAVASAQQAAPAVAAPLVRIVNRIDDTNLVTLRGNTHPAANAKNDRGRVSDSLPMTDLILVLSRDPAQQAAFTAFVNSEYDQNSPNYHQWLTPQQVGEDFGPSQTDIATITGWLTGHGFTVTQVTKDRMSIRFNGTAGQVTSAFHTEIHNLQVTHDGQVVNHIANMSDPQIPAALAPVVVGIKSLHNFFPRPEHHMGQNVQRDAKTGRWARQTIAGSSLPAALGTRANPSASSAAANALGTALAPRTLLSPPATAATAQPQFGISVGGSSPYLVEDVGPWDFASIYNITPLWTAGIDGTGQTIAIAGTSAIDIGEIATGTGAAVNANGSNDVATFRTFFDLPTNNSWNTPIQMSGNTEPLTVCNGSISTPLCGLGDLEENTLDVEWSGSVAKNAQIVLVSSYPASDTDDNLYDSESYIVNNLTARIMNVSYGECELGLGTGGNVEYYNMWQTAASEGIAVFVAAGDSGSASCDDGGDDGGDNLPYPAEYGLSVSGLASTPYNTAVGGTDFDWCPLTSGDGCATEAGTYWNTSNSSTTQSNAKGYVPEVPWNDTCTSPLSLSFMQQFATAVDAPQYTASNNANYSITDAETECNWIGYYAEALSDNGDGVLLYLVDTVGGGGGASNCVSNNTVNTQTSYTGGTVASCAVSGVGSTGATTDPDTGASQGSLATYNNGWPKPSWQAGVTGIPGDGVRDLPDVSFFASDGFLSSSAYLVCVSQATEDPECTYSTSSEPFAEEVGGTSVATPAMAGVMALIDQKSGAAQGNPNTELYALATKQTYANCKAETATTGDGCYFNAIDTGTNAMACDYAGYVTTPSPNCTVAHAGDYFGILPGFSGSAGYNAATGLGSLNIANVVNAWTATVGAAAATVTVTPAPPTINSNNSLSVTVTVAGTGTLKDPNAQTIVPTGSVTLTAGTYSATEFVNSSGSYTFTVPANSLPGTSTGEVDTLMASYAGDENYAAKSGSGNVTVTTTVVTLLTPTVTISPASATLNSNASLSVPVAVTGSGGTPTGSVTLTAGTYNSSAQPLVAGAYTFTIPANTFTTAGANNINVNYSGDGVYAASPTNGKNVTVTESTISLPTSESGFTFNPTTASTTGISPGASATVVVPITAVAGYTGVVALTCAQSATTATGGDGVTCTGGGSNTEVTLTSGTTSGMVTFTVGTTASSTTTVDLTRPKLPGRNWLGAGSGAVLALFVFFGIPARRRSWRSMLCVLVALVALGAMASCGGGSSSSGGGGCTSNCTITDPGTTAGTYTLTVTATTTPSVTPAVTTTFTVVVN